MKTEGARDAAATLVGLVATCRRGEHKFRAAAARITDPTLRRLLDCYAEQRAAFAAELQQALARTGKAQAISGAPHPAPGEGEPKARRAGGAKGEAALICVCQRGEAAALSAYREALQGRLAGGTKHAVEQQYAQVRDAHDHVLALAQARGMQVH